MLRGEFFFFFQGFWFWGCYKCFGTVVLWCRFLLITLFIRWNIHLAQHYGLEWFSSNRLQPCRNHLLPFKCGHLSGKLTDGADGCQLLCLSWGFLQYFIRLVTLLFLSMYLQVVALCFSWDESSSISSGLSDGDGECSENLSSEEFNASSSLSSLPSTPLGSRRNSSAMVSWKSALKKTHSCCFSLFFLKRIGYNLWTFRWDVWVLVEFIRGSSTTLLYITRDLSRSCLGGY